MTLARKVVKNALLLGTGAYLFANLGLYVADRIIYNSLENSLSRVAHVMIDEKSETTTGRLFRVGSLIARTQTLESARAEGINIEGIKKFIEDYQEEESPRFTSR